MVGLVPTHLADPLERLDWVHDQLRTAKDHDAVPADVLADVSAVAAPVVFARAARVKHMIPVSAIHDGLGFNITIISHESDIDVGLVADREMIDDLCHVAGLFEESAKELYEAAGV